MSLDLDIPNVNNYIYNIRDQSTKDMLTCVQTSMLYRRQFLRNAQKGLTGEGLRIFRCRAPVLRGQPELLEITAELPGESAGVAHHACKLHPSGLGLKESQKKTTTLGDTHTHAHTHTHSPRPAKKSNKTCT